MKNIFFILVFPTVVFLGMSISFAHDDHDEQEQSELQISDDDLSKFASFFPVLSEISQKGMEQINTLFARTGINLFRYKEVMEVIANENEPEGEEEEISVIRQLSVQIDSIQSVANTQIEMAAVEAGWEIEHLNQVIKTLENDHMTRAKLQEFMQKNME